MSVSPWTPWRPFISDIRVSKLMIMESLRQREGHLWLSCFSTWRLSSFIFVHDWETLMRIASLVVWFPTPVLSVITATLVSQVDFPVWVTFDGMSFRCSLLSAVTLACCYSSVHLQRKGLDKRMWPHMLWSRTIPCNWHCKKDLTSFVLPFLAGTAS